MVTLTLVLLALLVLGFVLLILGKPHGRTLFDVAVFIVLVVILVQGAGLIR